MFDKYKKRYQTPKAGERVRNQIAVEAARRMFEQLSPEPGDAAGHLREAAEADYYTAKRKAAAVLGHRVRPGDLPTDTEVRAQVLVLVRARESGASIDQDALPEPEGELAAMADYLDRFAIYRMRLVPLEAVKQNPKHHPEGDALYHSLQVFELARAVRPYDEEFLLAALLHDVGKGIDASDHVAAAVEALRGAVTERTLWLIEHHMDLLGSRERMLSQKARRIIDASEYCDDLKLLRDLDNAGRVPGAVVGDVEQVLAHLKGLEDEAYLTP